MDNIEEIKQLANPTSFRIAMTTPMFLNDSGWRGKRENRRKKCRIHLALIGDKILLNAVNRVSPKNRNYLVSARHLFNVGEKLGIFPYLHCGNGEKTQYKKGYSLRLISESVEALIAVVQLTYGKESATKFVTNAVIKPYLDAMPS